MFKITVYERIKNRRKELGLTADQVAEALNVSRATVYRYESSDIEKLPTTIIEPLCKILKTTPAYIMGWEEEDKEYGILGSFIGEEDEKYLEVLKEIKEMNEDEFNRLKMAIKMIKSNLI